jgi:antitoxin VapB
MAIYITNPEANRLARELVARTGETLTEAVTQALRERLERTFSPPPKGRLERLLAITARSATRPCVSAFTDHDLYGPDGLPT